MIAIDRGERAAVVFAQANESSEPAVEASVLVDLGEAGRPLRSSELDVRARAACEFLGRLYVFDERGLNRIDEGADPERDVATLAGLTAYPGTFRADAAAAGKRRLLAVGFDVAGIARIAEYDGVRLFDTELPRPPGFQVLGGPNGPARIGIAAVGDDRFVIALTDGRRVYAARCDGRVEPTEQTERIAWSAAESVRGARGLAVAKGEDGARVFVESETEDGARAIATFGVALEGAAPRLVARTGVPLERDETQIGTLPGLALESGAPAPVAARTGGGVDQGGLRVVADPDAEEPPPLVFAAWNMRTSRFEMPLLIHLGVYMVLGLLLRRRVETEPRVVMYRPAPYLRRVLAFLIDVIAALLVANLILERALGAPERRYLERFIPTTDLFASAQAIQDAIAAVTVAEISFVFLFVFMSMTAIAEGYSGRSLGKRLLGLRVVSLDGDRPSLGATLTRSAMLFVDAWPPFLGGLFLVLTRRRQRLGDIFGGTVVIESASLRVRAATRQEVERGEA